MSDSVDEVGGGASGARRRRRRRSWTREEKLRMVAESHEPGVSVSVVARRYDVNANQLFTWRREFADVEPDCQEHSFVPVVIPSEAASEAAPRDDDVGRKTAGPASAPEARGRMEISLAGGIRIVVDRTVDAAALTRVLAVLERR